MAASAVSRLSSRIYRRFPPLKPTCVSTTQIRHHGAYYPIDDIVFGLSEDQQQLENTIFYLPTHFLPRAKNMEKNNSVPLCPGFEGQSADIYELKIAEDIKRGDSRVFYSYMRGRTSIKEEVSKVPKRISSSGKLFADDSNYYMNNAQLEVTHEEKDLGIYVTPDWKSSAHVAKVAAKANSMSVKCITMTQQYWNDLPPDVSINSLKAVATQNTGKNRHGENVYFLEKSFSRFCPGLKLDREG
ncbi:unnamed protein product, partial [Meganyctiphanes norvegica]